MPVGARLALLEAAEPGPDVIAELAAFDADTLSEYDQVVLLRAIERQRHWLDALAQPVIAAVAGTQTDDHDWGREEVAAALNLSKLTAGRRVDTARMLAGPLAATLAALRAGRISYWHAAHLATETAGRPVDVALDVERLALPRAIGDGTRPGEGLAAFRRTVTRAVLQADPEQARANSTTSRADRRVVAWPGTASHPIGSVTAEGLTPDELTRVMTAIRYWAGKTGADDPRSHDQRMADAFVDICDDALSRAELTPARARKALTSLVMDYATWLGLAEHPAWLDGYGPIPADLARTIAADSSFRRLLVDPETGHLLDSTPTTYRPSAALRQYLVDRSRVCDGLGCNRPAARCDIDHTIRWTDGGTTTRDNTGPACGRDHPLRHEGGWKLAREPDGTTTWTSPTGHTYRKPPWDYRALQ